MLAQAVRGTRDILPDEIPSWLYLEARARDFFPRYGFREIRTPILEEISLFLRSLGQTSDVVEKQMFIIEKGEDRLVLRPEGTAGVARAYVEHRLDLNDPVQRYFYIGPMFRGERPQRGRLRQFHQLGVEIFGSDSPIVDVETILVMVKFLDDVGLKGYSLRINSVGCREDKERLSDYLREALAPRRAELCQDCQRRFDRNALRILDCKDPNCRKVVEETVDFGGVLCPDCQGHFQQVKAGLEELGIAYQEDRFLVRGLDYYLRTVFELSHPALGAGQDTVSAGGRYDGLIEEISEGKLSIPGIGFAIGLERLFLAMEGSLPRGEEGIEIAVIYSPGAEVPALKLAEELREAGRSVLVSPSARSFRSQMRWANRVSARWVLILGEEELGQGEVSIKDMSKGQQVKVALDRVKEVVGESA